MCYCFSKAMFTPVPVRVPVRVPVPFHSFVYIIAFIPANIDRTRSGSGLVTRSHLFRTRSKTRTVISAYKTVRSDVKII